MERPRRRDDAAAEVAQNYWASRLDQAQLAIVGDELARQCRILGIAEHQAQVGLVPSADLSQQCATVTSTEARAAPVRADTELRAHALATLLAQPPAALVAELSAPAPLLATGPTVSAGLPSDLLRRRPDIRAAERNSPPPPPPPTSASRSPTFIPNSP